MDSAFSGTPKGVRASYLKLREAPYPADRRFQPVSRCELRADLLELVGND